MALFTFNLPDIGEGISEAEIVNWHVAVDDIVKEDQPIADMMTDKATVDMESPVAGKIVAISGEIGDRVPIGSMLVVLEMEEQGGSETSVPEEENGRALRRVRVWCDVLYSGGAELLQKKKS